MGSLTLRFSTQIQTQSLLLFEAGKTEINKMLLEGRSPHNAPIPIHPAIQSLDQGHWFKLICGASFQHLPTVRELALVYGLAGADCIDMAADPAVIGAVQAGLDAAARRQNRLGLSFQRPLLMVSLNDGEDPHFRKAQFDPRHCPADCSRPCEAICPAQAIALPANLQSAETGVIESRCYGCGRCWPVCPIDNISSRSYVSAPAVVMEMAIAAGVEALEIHTQVGHFEGFSQLWTAISPWVTSLKLIAVSCPSQDGPEGEILEQYLPRLEALMRPRPDALIWQTDGRPMSGDIGAGTTHAAIQLSKRVLAMGLPGYVQLAGGTNGSTVSKLDALGLLKTEADHSPNAPSVAGVAYGSYGRSLLNPMLEQLTALGGPPGHLEDHPALLDAALRQAVGLIAPLKRPRIKS